MKNCRIKFLKKVDGNLIWQLPWPKKYPDVSIGARIIFLDQCVFVFVYIFALRPMEVTKEISVWTFFESDAENFQYSI